MDQKEKPSNIVSLADARRRKQVRVVKQEERKAAKTEKSRIELAEKEIDILYSKLEAVTGHLHDLEGAYRKQEATLQKLLNLLHSQSRKI